MKRPRSVKPKEDAKGLANVSSFVSKPPAIPHIDPVGLYIASSWATTVLIVMELL